MSEASPLTDKEFDVAFRDGATDEEIEAVLRHFLILEEGQALNGPWRLVLWPPKLDPDPRF